MFGDATLEAVEIMDLQTGERRQVATPAVFSFIGAVPRTGWLPPEIETDARGFIRTGPGVASAAHWPMERAPFLLETSRPGVFAAGDVRLGSIKRVASAVGEGAMAINYIHEYLTIPEASSAPTS
jgi:thioredoxin reductase (NADPH)